MCEKKPIVHDDLWVLIVQRLTPESDEAVECQIREAYRDSGLGQGGIRLVGVGKMGFGIRPGR